MSALDEIPLTTIKGEPTTLAAWPGAAKLIVNVASRCGLAPQYEQLEELQRRYGGERFTVLGFPSNQFLQELGSDEAVAAYCSATWGVTFPMFERVWVNGRGRHPLYKALVKTEDHTGLAGPVAWNFEKFLVMPDGAVHRFRPNTLPDDPAIVALIEQAAAA